MARDGYKILDSDMHVFEPHDLYLEIHGPQMGRAHPARPAANKHGQIKFTFADGGRYGLRERRR